MSGTDDRIVNMKFDNSQFLKGVSETMGLLDRLKSSLDFSKSKKGLDDLQTAGNKLSLDGLGRGVDSINAKFVALGTVAITTIANITNRAVNAGIQLAKSFTVDPLKSGLDEYATNLNSIQTILANTQSKGSTLTDVNKALQELNTYSDQTIYNFSEMARNIGTFTAAGVKLDTATSSIKGIANLAALSGSNSEQASTAMYQLSQAIAAGKVSLQDWNSVVNAGLGGEVFQRALFTNAKQMKTLTGVPVGTTFEEWTKKGGSFRTQLEKGFVTSEVLTRTLAQFTGDMTDAQLKAQGFTDAQVKAIQVQAKTAQDAATKVKTIGQLIGTLREASGSGWTQTWQYIFGDFEEARTAFTEANNTLSGFINGMSDARNKVLKDWHDLGGRTVIIESIKNVFHALMDILIPVSDAFHEFFPRKTGKDLYEFSLTIQRLTERLKPSEQTIDRFARTMSGVFAVMDIGKYILLQVIKLFGRLFSSSGVGDGTGFLGLTANIGDMLVDFRNLVVAGGGVEKFFDKLGDILEKPIRFLKFLTAALSDFLDGFSTSKIKTAANGIGDVASELNPLGRISARFSAVWEHLTEVWQKLADVIAPVAKAIGEQLSNLGDAIGAAMTTGNFDKVLDIINVGLLGAIVVLIKKFLSGGVNIDLGGGILGQVRESLDLLTGSAKAMQTQIKAKTLLLIAGAIALLTASVVALSLIDSQKLTVALGAMAAGFAQLLAGMAVLVKISGSAGFVKLPIVAASLILLSTAILIMTFALRSLSGLDWDQIGKGLAGIAGILAALSAAVIPLSANSSGMIRASVAMIILSVALVALAGAVKLYSMFKWEEIGKGIAGVALTLGAIGTAMMVMPPNLIANSVGLVLIAGALQLLAISVEKFASFKWEVIGKGLAAMALTLGAIGVAMTVFPPNILVSALALVVITGALEVLADVLDKMGNQGWDVIGKGLATLAGSLIILASGLILMTGALPGAAALLIAAGALAILTPVLIALGNLSIKTIATGLAAIAAVFIVLGVAGLALAPLTPTIIALSVAVLALGAGLALLGLGALAFAAAFSVLAAVGTAGVAVITALFGAIIGLIPAALKAFADGVVLFAVTIGNAAPQIAEAVGKLIVAILDLVIQTAPKFGEAFLVLLDTAVKVILNSVPKLADAGLKLLIGLLSAISNNLPQVITKAADIIIALVKGLADNGVRITNAAADAIITFIRGVTKAIQDHDDEFIDAGYDLAGAIIDGIVKGLLEGVKRVASAAGDVAKGAAGKIGSFFGIHSPSRLMIEYGGYIDEGLALGLTKNGYSAVAGSEVAQAALNNMRDTLARVSDIAADEIDVNPVIAPVIDLDAVRQGASQIGALMAAQSLQADASYSVASGIANQQAQAAKDAAEAPDVAPTVIQFEQNNTSPEALSGPDIYRQTKNLIAVAKEALAV